MANKLNSLINTVGEGLFNGIADEVCHNRYTLMVDNLISPISVIQVQGDEQLNQPWYYTIDFTSIDKTLSPDAILNQKASFYFNPAMNNVLETAIRSLSDRPIESDLRKISGVITRFNVLSVSKEQAHYQIMLSPRLARLALNRNHAIFQNQSVISVVEEVLRSHGFTGIDYRLELNNRYPEREFITQWQESDLSFIQRLLADIGVWFRFETHAEHNCDVMVISDNEQGYEQASDIDYRLPSDTLDGGTESIWNIRQDNHMVKSSVKVQDYNYRDAKAKLLSEVNSQPKDSTTYGTDYRYDEHYKERTTYGQEDKVEEDNDNRNSNGSTDQRNQIETGQWYAKIRHEQAISKKTLISGKSNRYHLTPGQRIQIKGSPLVNVDDGMIILSVEGHGNRTDAYELSFTAIPYQVLKPYRPEPLKWPKMVGTLSARVTSPDNDTYGYIDTQGRYRVKFNYDLKEWKKGYESLWVRQAKPYAGGSYGFHFPLIDGTEVAIAFTKGNPDRPYIAHAMHDSTHPDLVTTINKHRNVIRTPTNNKLRMDDKRGQEHIKLATEYGKTQLNIGHLVNSNKEQRGEGFELRTDKWGAIAANRGLYLTSQTEPKAQGKQLDMQGAMAELENALSIAKALQNAAQQAQTHASDTDSQQHLQSALKDMNQAGILAYAQEGIALTSPENIQLTCANNITVTTASQTDITALKNITLSTSEAISLLAQKSGMKVLANQGDIDVQAQNANLNMLAKQDIQINSVESKVDISAAQEITFICGGSYIKISEAGIELGSPENVYLKCNAMQKMSPATLNKKIQLKSSELDVKLCTEMD
ncbi:type VI secretion system tip protein VgrG [Gilliamella sp. B2776]|uniref:type VI secretion system Vgr family protein n=2 Tax=Gilliamella TaxID=1193503 RepID=UPI002269C9A9|nr:MULTISPECIES: type VI secretion system Vgr family protein [unclassified Gilliamella]MCX8691453.1 type VI secretion system tip protein VgrG [Gilliamella sp. B2776]WDM18641.1 type VI secretion system tip protein VgrG [Gilliamella sp. B3022]